MLRQWADKIEDLDSKNSTASSSNEAPVGVTDIDAEEIEDDTEELQTDSDKRNFGLQVGRNSRWNYTVFFPEEPFKNYIS